jgi:hypothetical protein
LYSRREEAEEVQRITPRSWVATCVVALAAAITAGAPAQASSTAGLRMTERPVRSLAPDADAVKESLVKVHKPLPASYGPHPKSCDWISTLRFRGAGGPRNPADADAVFVIIPGFLGGASSFDQIARHMVEAAAKRGNDVEFWSIDRRANCLEDDTGINAGVDDRDASVAYDYYWHAKPAGGRTFPGWVSHADADWLRHVGLARTMRDWHTVMKAAIPSRRVRAQKMFCGGHSLGGPLTAAFAAWDFDDNPKTNKDAGYRQCAAFVGLDTKLSLRAFSGSSTSPTGVLFNAITASNSPYVDVSPLTPETIQLPAVFAVGSYFKGQGTDLLPELPHSTNIDLAQRLLYSRDAANFATQKPSIRDFTLTNQSVLAGVFDDNSQPLTFLRASVGSATGGPLTDKNFPTRDPTLALPEDTDTPLYSWETYDEVGAHGNPIPLNDEGQPYTSRESEVSGLRSLARAMFDAPQNFVEQYFPTKILRDVQDAGEGDRSGSLSHLRYDNGIGKRPAILINAGDSSGNDGKDTGRPVRGKPPNDRPLSRKLKIPGYNHLDVATAARRQNDGRPEPSSTALANFGRDVIGKRSR